MFFNNKPQLIKEHPKTIKTKIHTQIKVNNASLKNIHKYKCTHNKPSKMLDSLPLHKN